MTILRMMAIAACFAAPNGFAEHENCTGHDHHHHGHGNNALESVEVGESAVRSMGLKTVRPQLRRMRSTVVFPGRFELASDARKDASAPVAGRLSLKVRELDMVKEGDVLFTVASPAIKALSQEIEVLRGRLDVYRKLKTTNAEIEAALKVKATEKAALVSGAEEKDGTLVIRSGADAMVESLSVADGAWVESGSAVAKLVNTRALRFKALVPSAEADVLCDGMKAEIEDMEAEVRLGVGDASGMTPVYAIFAEDVLWGKPGRFAEMQCVLDGKEAAVIAVPEACVVKIGAEPAVFVRDSHKAGRFFAVKVELGLSSGGWCEVKGLPADGRLEVVKEGAYELKLALAAKSSGAKTAGHFHADGTFHEGDGH